MSRVSRLLLAITLILCVWVCFLSKRNKFLSSENSRVKANQNALLGQMRRYKFSDSLNAASVDVLTMTNGELKRQCADLTAKIKKLGIVTTRVDNVSVVATKTTRRIDVPISVAADSALQSVHYDDRHITFDGTLYDGVFHGEICVRDTLTQVIHRVPRKFLFIRWGTKAVRQEIVCSNPYTHIVYARVIRLSR